MGDGNRVEVDWFIRESSESRLFVRSFHEVGG